MKKLLAIFIFFIFLNVVSFAQGKIIMNGAKMTAVNAAYIVTKDVSLTSQSSINVNNSTIIIAGSIANNSGIFDVTSGTVEMNGTSPQTIPANSFFTNKIQNLVISNDVTLGGEDSLTNTLSFGAGNKTFSTAGWLTLKSTSVSTAKVADITNSGATSGNAITGNVKVERYIPGHRAWRLLTNPVIANGQTINDAWQEGQTSGNAVPGFGAHITGGSIANGFDQGVNLNPSLKIYMAGAWVGVPNTNATSITNQPGYMIFVRGGRDVILSQGIAAAVTNTVLRTTGQLKTNAQSFTVAASGFTLIGNPYASPVNLYNIAKANSINIQDNFYLWDPMITGTNGVGGYVNVSWNGSSYDVTPSTGVTTLNEYVHSGSAFFAKTINGTTSGTLIIKETDKYAATLMGARPVVNRSPVIKTNLYSKNADGSTSIVDGILNRFDAIYSNSIDNYDADKIMNFSETLSCQREGKLLMVERRQPVNSLDTIFLHMLRMKVKSYFFEIAADNFNDNSLSAFLEDSYTNSSTPVNLNGKTTVDFNVIDVPGSWNPNRFHLIFKRSAVLPVTFSAVKAFELNNNIEVEWKVENEANISQYEIEKSVDGQQFIKANAVIAKGNNSGVSNYNWLDAAVLEGYNYYRIKSIGANGEIKYSQVMKVFIGTAKQEITLATNVVTGNTITLQLTNAPKGTYALSVTNNSAQIMFTKKIEHAGGSSTQNLKLTKNFITGIYHLNVTKPDQANLVLRFLKN